MPARSLAGVAISKRHEGSRSSLSACGPVRHAKAALHSRLKCEPNDENDFLKTARSIFTLASMSIAAAQNDEEAHEANKVVAPGHSLTHVNLLDCIGGSAPQSQCPRRATRRRRNLIARAQLQSIVYIRRKLRLPSGGQSINLCQEGAICLFALRNLAPHTALESGRPSGTGSPLFGAPTGGRK